MLVQNVRKSFYFFPNVFPYLLQWGYLSVATLPPYSYILTTVYEYCNTSKPYLYSYTSEYSASILSEYSILVQYGKVTVLVRVRVHTCTVLGYRVREYEYRQGGRCKCTEPFHSF